MLPLQYFGFVKQRRPRLEMTSSEVSVVENENESASPKWPLAEHLSRCGTTVPEA